MNEKPQAGLRLVKCPKCGKILPEPEQVPVYACGGCNTILRAKYYRNDSNARGLSSHQEPVTSNGVANAISDGESDGLSQRSSSSNRHSLGQNEDGKNQSPVVNCDSKQTEIVDSGHHNSLSDGSTLASEEENRKTGDEIVQFDQHEDRTQEQVPDSDSPQETLEPKESSVSDESLGFQNKLEKEGDGISGQCLSEKLEGIKLDEGDSGSVCSSVMDVTIPREGSASDESLGFQNKLEKEEDRIAGHCLSEKLEGIKLDEGDSVSVCSSVKDAAIPREESGGENQLRLRNRTVRNSNRNHGLFYHTNLPSYHSYEAACETGSCSSYGKPETWLRKGHVCTTNNRSGYPASRRRICSEEVWRENDQFLAPSATYYGYETASGEIYPRTSGRIYHGASGQIYPGASEEIYPRASGEIYPRAGYQYHDGYNTYVDRRRRSESWSQNGSHPRVPYSGEVFDSLRNPYMYQHQYPGDLRWSTQFPRWDPYEPKPYCGSRQEVVVSSGGHRYRDPIMRRTYVREKRQPVKRHLEPVAGGAPFISCYFCSRVLRIPKDFVIPRRGWRKTRKLKCGACSKVLEFRLENERDSAAETNVRKDADADVRELVSVSDRSVGSSSRKEGSKPESENEERREETETENAGISVQERQMKVTWKLPAQTKSPLHKLMGYSSPHELLKEVS